jgi:perosamine synthetase
MYSNLIARIKEVHGDAAFVPLHAPRFEGNEVKYLTECITSTYVSSVGPFVDKVEASLASYTGSCFAVACVNGTAALHVSLILAGVRRDDLVITQSLSFIATSNAITYIGASPVFVDVDEDTMGLSPVSLEAFLDSETKTGSDGKRYHNQSGRRIAACVPMHTFGHPARIDEIARVCEAYGVALVEDAAESIGSFYKGRHTGTSGMMGTLSFNGNKTITAGGGGAIITNDETLARRAKHLTTQAKVPHKWEFVHDETGFNYRMPNINAALLYAQMEKLDEFISRKRKLAGVYKEIFSGEDIKFMAEPANSKSNYWLCAVMLKDKPERDKFLEATNAAGLMTRPVWRLMHRLEMYKNCITGPLKVSEMLEERIVNIPSSAIQV